ncbi:MAG: hypothetical protein J7K21_06300 [Desulfurococcales archaeon]|nr:hypothetical protein [Desulfurococcales archaeon]
MKPLQKIIDHGIVSGIVCPCNPRSKFKPIIVIYADEYPLGEMLELGIILDEYNELTNHSFVTIEADQFQARVIEPKKVIARINDIIKARKSYISPTGIIDLFKPTNFVDKIPIEEALNYIIRLHSHPNIYIQGLINYLRRRREQGLHSLSSIKIEVELLG